MLPECAPCKCKWSCHNSYSARKFSEKMLNAICGAHIRASLHNGNLTQHVTGTILRRKLNRRVPDAVNTTSNTGRDIY